MNAVVPFGELLRMPPAATTLRNIEHDASLRDLCVGSVPPRSSSRVHGGRGLVGLLARAVALTAAVLLASCNEATLPKHERPLSVGMKRLLETKSMEETSPILVRLFKEESEAEIWKMSDKGYFEHLKTYEICSWSGRLGPKYREGDRQAPEGFYTVRPWHMNPTSENYLAFNIGFPNKFDKANGRTGSNLMVHGGCSSRGCFAVTDDSVQEIFTLARLSFAGGQRRFQVQSFPFRMTPVNMARHRDNPNMPFWEMLKEGSDHFEVTRQTVKVDVCERQYVFNAIGNNFSPRGRCPQIRIPTMVRLSVAAKAAQDDKIMQRHIARIEGRPVAAASSEPNMSTLDEFLLSLLNSERSVGPFDKGAIAETSDGPVAEIEALPPFEAFIDQVPVAPID